MRNTSKQLSPKIIARVESGGGGGMALLRSKISWSQKASTVDVQCECSHEI